MVVAASTQRNWGEEIHFPFQSNWPATAVTPLVGGSRCLAVKWLIACTGHLPSGERVLSMPTARTRIEAGTRHGAGLDFAATGRARARRPWTGWAALGGGAVATLAGFFGQTSSPVFSLPLDDQLAGASPAWLRGLMPGGGSGGNQTIQPDGRPWGATANGLRVSRMSRCG